MPNLFPEQRIVLVSRERAMHEYSPAIQWNPNSSFRTHHCDSGGRKIRGAAVRCNPHTESRRIAASVQTQLQQRGSREQSKGGDAAFEFAAPRSWRKRFSCG